MVRQADILRYRAQADQRGRDTIIANARSQGRQTAFLSHSHHDKDIVKRVQPFLQDNGWNVYVDWADNNMPTTTSSETASKIKTKIVELDWFLFLATQNSMNSKWCPWEIGYADGMKVNSRIVIIPTEDQLGRTHGSEYLDLYRKINDGTNRDSSGQVIKRGFAIFNPNASRGTWIDEITR